MILHVFIGSCPFSLRINITDFPCALCVVSINGTAL